VAEHQGRTVFVEGALPGERVLARIDASQKVWRAALVEVLEPSEVRRAPECPLADRCGGCDWLHLSEPAQAAAKEEIVLSALEHLGQFERSELTVLPHVPSANPMGYRRRAVLHFSKGALGFYARRSHECLPVERCPALVPALQALPAKLSGYLGSVRSGVAAVHLLCAGDQVSFALILDGPLKPRLALAVERAVRELGLKGAVLVPAEGSPTLVGKPVLRTAAPLRPEVPLLLRPDAFSQANEEGNQALVAAAVDGASPGPGDRVLELFSGNGNFTFALAGLAREVLAVEASGVSAELARRAVAEGRVGNVRIIQGDARKVTEGLVAEGARFELLFADPPRAGMPGLATLARGLGVRRVVYVACDPASLARDGAQLRDAGYVPQSLQLVDMFPQTRHVEAVMAFAQRA
jgi:23S rRNA (uracil1939-C5)-methyltransferase